MAMTAAGEASAQGVANVLNWREVEAPGRLQIFAVLVAALGFAFDLGEIAFGSALSGLFSAPPYAIAPGQLSWLLAATYAGAIIGPPLVCPFADRRGRRTALSAALLLLAVASLAGAASPDIRSLTIARGISGIALGAYPPLMITYLSELLPARRRGPLIMVAVAIAYLAPPATIFLMRWLMPLAPLGLDGWRWVIGAAGCGAGVAGLLYLLLPELPRWQAASKADGTEKPDRRRFAFVASLFFFNPWATVAFPLLTGAILVQRGFTLLDTLFYVGVSAFGPFVGTVLVASFADRLERRTALVACALGMIVSAIGFWISNLPLLLMITSLGFNLFVALYQPAINVYAAELFPIRARARATTWSWSVNRIAAALGPLVLLPMLHSVGLGAVFAVVIGAMLASIALVLLFGPRGEAGRPIG